VTRSLLGFHLGFERFTVAHGRVALIVGRGHLEQVLHVYVEHYKRHRPHRRSGWDRRIPSPV